MNNRSDQMIQEISAAPRPLIMPSTLRRGQKVSYMHSPPGAPARRVDAVVKWSGIGNATGIMVPVVIDGAAVLEHDGETWMVYDSEAEYRDIRVILTIDSLPQEEP